MSVSLQRVNRHQARGWHICSTFRNNNPVFALRLAENCPCALRRCIELVARPCYISTYHSRKQSDSAPAYSLEAGTMRKRIFLLLAPVFACTLMLAGCGVSSNNPKPTPPPSATFHADFHYSSSGYELPFPTDLYFLGSEDGTVNIQGLPDPNDYSSPLVAINALDGFSSTAPVTEQFSEALDPASLAGNVYVFSVTTDPSQGYAVTGVNGVDRKSTRLNSSHVAISYAVFCLKKKNTYNSWSIIQSIVFCRTLR